MADDFESTQKLLYKLIGDRALTVKSPKGVLELAEAFAWVSVPGQPHGGNISTSVEKG
jgi:hypothetical protein